MVDPTTLKVYGTSNLRVVDASVIPLIIGTHPQSTIYAVAERVSIGYRVQVPSTHDVTSGRRHNQGSRVAY